jgi:hypothetical protein
MSGRSDYGERKTARIERLHEKAIAAGSEAIMQCKKASAIGEHIPLGQPILVGHHSESRARRDAARIDGAMRKSVQASERAECYAERAESAENNSAISSDDPDAPEKLQEKIDDLKAQQEFMKAANKYYRKHKTCRGCPDVNDELAEKLDGRMKTAYSWEKAPFRSYELTSVNNRIKAAEERIKRLQAIDEIPAQIIAFKGGEITVDNDINRVVICFDERQPDEVTARLKSRGFKWSRNVKGWLRLKSRAALRTACDICGIEEGEK